MRLASLVWKNKFLVPHEAREESIKTQLPPMRCCVINETGWKLTRSQGISSSPLQGAGRGDTLGTRLHEGLAQRQKGRFIKLPWPRTPKKVNQSCCVFNSVYSLMSYTHRCLSTHWSPIYHPPIDYLLSLRVRRLGQAYKGRAFTVISGFAARPRGGTRFCVTVLILFA